MGQKVSPHGLRVGVIKDWDSKWYAAKKDFADFLVEDSKIRKYVKKRLYAAGISRIVVERPADNKIRIGVVAGKTGLIIGRSGEGINTLKAELEKMTGKTVDIDVREVRREELDAQLTAERIAQDLEKRISFRRAMKQAIGRTMKSGAKGIKVSCAGRLGGAEIARSEKYSEGNVPLHTLRANIDYGFAEADTTYGKLGIKVWINHGEILDKGLQSTLPEEKKEERGERRDRRDRGERGERRDRRDRGERRERRDGDREGRRDGARRGRDDRPAVQRAVNPRKRPQKPQQVEKPAELNEEVNAPQVEEAQVEAAAVETAAAEN